ncbi:MAG TPA: metallophosphoesterase [Roseiflexaceae bacterium]|nr:metallophosphoesterase [Roseiflexaceae bacterium]
MSFRLTKSSARLWSLDAGVAMVVTDLHGDWDTYVRYRDRFIELRAARLADCLIFTGDLIHREPDAGADRSLDMVLDILALQERYGDAIVYLCGNHELPHLYGFVLGKGRTEYTPGFEAALSQSGRRGDILALFESLPFFIRTAAGVSIMHAGASAPLADRAQAARLFDWDHGTLRAWAGERLAEGDRAELRSGYARLSGESAYDAMARRYLAVSGPADPRYDDLLGGFFVTAHPDFRIVRRALFTRCEQEDSEEAYTARLTAALEQLSVGYAPQRLLVAGHMATLGGHTVVAQRHLRLASGAHARPATARAYLLFDTARSIESIDDLLSGLQPIA